MYKKYYKWLLLMFLLLAVALGVIIWSLTTGELKIPVSSLPSLFFNSNTSIESIIFEKIRLPRIILGFFIGGALSLAGVILQGIYRNPLVEPYTLGISGGAALGVALTIVLGLQIKFGSYLLPLSGFVGSLITVLLVYWLSIRQGKLVINKMILVGVMVSFIASSFMMFLLATTSTENLHGIIFWVMGSLDEPDTRLIKTAVIISVIGLVASYFFIQALNALRLGEEKAQQLGINTHVALKLLFAIASLLTGMCVSIAGIIGFVGLIIPQFLRFIIKPDYRILLIASFITGGSFLVFCDTIARTIILPNELPIGVITGIIGGLAFIVILLQSNSKTI